MSQATHKPSAVLCTTIPNYDITFKNYYRFATNVFVVSLTSILLNSLDFLMIKSFGPEYLAALGQVTAIIAVIAGMAYGVYSITGMRFAKLLGSSDFTTRGADLLYASFLALIPPILLTIATIWALPTALTILGQPEDVVALARTYTGIIWLRVPCMVVSMWASFLFRILDLHWLLYLRVGIALTVNFTLNYVLLFHWQILDPIQGVAVSTLIAEMIGCLSYVSPFWKKVIQQHHMRLTSRSMRHHLPGMCDILRNGYPISVALLNDCIQSIVISIFVGWLGTQSLAAYNIAFTTAIYMYRLPQACVTAMETFYAFHFGKGHRQRLSTYLGYSIVSSLFLIVLIYLISPLILAYFSNAGTQIYRYSYWALMAILLYYPFYFLEQHLNVIIVVHEQSSYLMKASSISSYLFMIPMAYFVGVQSENIFYMVLCQGTGSIVLTILFALKVLSIYGYTWRSRCKMLSGVNHVA